MFSRHRLAPFIFLLCPLPTFAQSPKPRHARLSLISEYASLAPGNPDWIGVRFDLDPGWHIYWTNPGDSGEPPKIAWQLPPGFQIEPLQFPVPQRIQDHSLTDYGYEGSAVLLTMLKLGPTAVSQQANISGDVTYLVCREVCIPGKEHVELSLNVAAGVKPSPDIARIESAKKLLPRPFPGDIYASADPQNFVLTIPSRTTRVRNITDFIPADEQVIENTAKPTISPIPDATVITLKKSEQLNHPVTKLRGLLIASGRAYNVIVPVSSKSSRSHPDPKKE